MELADKIMFKIHKITTNLKFLNNLVFYQIYLKFKLTDWNNATIRQNDGDPTSQLKDSLCDIGGPMTRSMTKRMKQILQGLIMEVKGSSTHYIRGYSKVDHFSTSWWRFEPNMKTTWQKSKFTRQSIHGLKLISFMVWIIIEDSFSYFVGNFCA